MMLARRALPVARSVQRPFESTASELLFSQEVQQHKPARRISMDVKVKKVSDREMDDLERQVPGQARKATLSAFIRALSVSQRGVLCIDAGDLVRVWSDGRKTVVAKAKPRRKVTVGEVITVRRVEGQTAGGRA